ncbi:MAG: hypothetical protein ACTSYI_10635 [Promethearchaeota archaeon]
MINQFVNLLKEEKQPQEILKSSLDYDMIIVDKFQDISSQRFQLLQQIMRLNLDKIILRWR